MWVIQAAQMASPITPARLCSQILRGEPCLLADAGQHRRADLLPVVEGPHVVRVPGALQYHVRPAPLGHRALRTPADLQERGDDPAGLASRPARPGGTR